MKKRNYKLLVAALLILALPGCAEPAPKWDGRVSVTLVDSPFIDVLSTRTVLAPRHSDVAVTLAPLTNYYISSVSYPDYTLIPDGEAYTLVLKDVAYSTRVEIECMEGDTIIDYDCNGGKYISGDAYWELYSLTHHLRPNTSIGTDVLERDGFTLVGWNTEPDGSGEAVGLGSRCTVEKGGRMTLYAQWLQWSPVSDFVFAGTGDGEALTVLSYLGNDAAVILPERVHGKPVTAIAQGAFTGCAAETVVLPKTMKQIEAAAFKSCGLKELYFYDSLIDLSDACFVDCPEFYRVHINAIQPPRYAGFDRHSTYADKVDNLILNRDKKKIVLFGGSGAYYSLDACTIAESIPGYEVFNMGINAWFNAWAQMEIMLPYIGEGDVLLHAPEMMSEYQFMAQNDMGLRDGKPAQDARFFMCTELNYDLLTNIDLRHVTAFFDTYSLYNENRQALPRTSYSDYTDFCDARGDYQAYRLVTAEKIGSISGEAGLNIDLLSDENMAALNSCYDRFAEKGCTVLRAFACENIDGFSDADRETVESFACRFAEKSPYPVINQLKDVLYPTTYFCDTDWHLTYDHAAENTKALIPAILDHLGG